MAVAVVLGGGMSGLSTAYYLRKLASSKISKVILIEKSKRFGGWVESTHEKNNVINELGPRSVRTAGKVGRNTLDLIEEIGLESSLIPVGVLSPAARNRYVVHNGKLVVLPVSLQPVFKATPPFNQALIWHALNDIIKRRSRLEDESVHDFISRRFGDDVANYGADPLCRGVVAGCSKSISVRSLFPNFYKAEQKYGSVIRGMLKLSKETQLNTEEPSKLYQKAKVEKWAIWNMHGGLQEFPDTLARRLQNDENVEMISNQACDSLAFEDGIAKVQVGDRSFEANHVVSCLPSFNTADILNSQAPRLASLLSKIKFVNVAVVSLEYSGNLVTNPAFGYLIPSCELSKVLGVIYDSCVFKEHDGNDGIPRTRFTCMMGGHWFEQHFGNVDQVDEDYILKLAVDEIKTRLSIDAPPVKYKISIQKNCIPQYKVGHHAIMQDIKDELKSLGYPLSLTGSSYEGVSVNDVIYNAKETVKNLVDAAT